MLSVFRWVFGAIGIVLLLVGLGSIAVLVKIGGKSDGPGAIVFFIGVFFGIGGGWTVLTSVFSKKDP